MDEPKDPSIIWQPLPGTQTLAMSCPFDELLVHGTRGSSKTDGLVMDFAQDCGKGYGAAWRGILFRETFPQLEDVILKTKKWYPQIFPGIKYNASNHIWTWPDGEELLLRFIAKEDDYWNYHGHEYPWIGWEELTTWKDIACYEAMKSTNRSSTIGIPKRIRSTTNPWGPGHDWVKQYFIDATPPGVPKTDTIKHPLTGDPITTTRTHLFGSILENTYLIEADPKYLANLMNIKDKNKKKAWLYGSWDINPTSYFGDVWDESKHWIKSFTPPEHWVSYPSFDWGSASPFSLGFTTVSDGTEAPDGNFYPRGAKLRFDEVYGYNPDEPNTGVRWSNERIGKMIREKLEFWESKGVSFQLGPADPSIFKEDGGPSIADQMRVGMKKLVFEKADNQRVAGWQKMFDDLDGKQEGDDVGKPMLYIMDRCPNWKRTVPILPKDPKNWDDIDTETEDHIADESRYAQMHTPRVLTVVEVLGI